MSSQDDTRPGRSFKDDLKLLSPLDQAIINTLVGRIEGLNRRVNELKEQLSRHTSNHFYLTGEIFQ